jgi:phage terminase small subunit
MIRARVGETDGAILPPAPNRSLDALMRILSNPRHERFAQELANGVSATEAYERAGFARNRVSAHRLKQKPNIGERVCELLKQREHINAQATAKAIEKTALTKQWVIERLMSFAKCADKDAASVRALELLGKELGMFVDHHANVSAHYAISDKPMTMEEWALEYTGQPLPK